MVKPVFGVARIVPSDDDTYRPDPAGEYAAILGVHDRDGELVDLCAWFPDRPGRWWLRYGDVFVIGARNIAIAADFDNPIVLHSTPQEWALAHGHGACLLRWSFDPRGWFEGVSAVRCDSQALAARFQTAIRNWEPKLTISRVVTRHAA